MCCSMGRFPLPTEKQRHQIVQHRKNYEMNLSASLRMQVTTQRGTSAPPKVCKSFSDFLRGYMVNYMFTKTHCKEFIPLCTYSRAYVDCNCSCFIKNIRKLSHDSSLSS